MLRDGRTITAGDRIDTDVCIIGAGPAGITVALALAETDLRVCLLESGDRDLTKEGQRLADGRSVGYSYYRLPKARARAFGGSSRLWPLDEGWRARPLDPVDFEARDWVPHSGWPFDHTELAPYYPRAQELCDLGPFDYSAERWAGPDTPPLPLDGERAQTTVFQLGSTDFSRHWDRLVGAPTVQLITHASVQSLSAQRAPGPVEHVQVTGGPGRQFVVQAKSYVLATGGLDNARLLLLSRSANPAGMGNGHDLVGRFFTERLSLRSGHVEAPEELIDRHAPLYTTRAVEGARVEATLRLPDEVIRRERLRNCTFFLLARPRVFASEGFRSVATLVRGAERQPFPAGVGGYIRNLVADAPRMARELPALVKARRTGEAPPRILALRPQAEQSPLPDSRVTLDPDTRDAVGMPRVRLHWRVADDDRASIRRHQELLGAELERAGVGSVQMPLGDEDPPAQFEGNKHHMGTTRMHRDPAHGVVDGDGRLHEAPNLFVAGSSTFPTPGCSNPTLAIVALSLRLAEHLKQELCHPQAGSG